MTIWYAEVISLCQYCADIGLYIVAKIPTRHSLRVPCSCARMCRQLAPSCTSVSPSEALSILATDPYFPNSKSQKIYKPEFFGWVKATKENKLSLETAGVHLVKGKLGVSDTTHSTTDAEGSEEREESRFGGQISKHVLATEFMPMLRLLQRTGHGM